MAFTAKQKLFIHEYAVDFNATQAALRAGYSPRTAYSIGNENLKKPEIKEEIRKIVKERIMEADETMARLSGMAKGDIGEFLIVEEDGTTRIDLEAMKTAGKTYLIKKVKQQKRIVEESNEKKGTEKVKTDWVSEIELYSAKEALELIGKYHKLFTERHMLTDGEGKPLIALELFEKALEKVYGNKIGSDNGPEAEQPQS
jgi:phage terminase small subunit